MDKIKDVKVYDFKQAKKFSIDNIRFLKLMCGEFCRTSNIHFNYEFKDLKIKFNVSNYSQSSHSEVLSDTDKDSILIEFDIKPLVEDLVLIMDKSTALSLIDLCSGGTGVVDNRELTAIDTEVLVYLMSNLLKKLYIPNGCNHTEITNVYTSTAQYNNNLGDDVFICSYRITTAKGSIGTIDMCLPYIKLEGILDQLLAEKFISPIGDTKPENVMYNTIKDSNLVVQAELGKTVLPLSKLESLNVGDIIPLMSLVTDDVIVDVSGSKVYKGRFGLNGAKRGVVVRDLIEGVED